MKTIIVPKDIGEQLKRFPKARFIFTTPSFRVPASEVMVNLDRQCVVAYYHPEGEERTILLTVPLGTPYVVVSLECVDVLQTDGATVEKAVFDEELVFGKTTYM